MGLANYILEGIVREHCYRAITGGVVQIGRQTIELTVPDTIHLFTRYELRLDALGDGAVEIDHQTTQVRQTGRQFISDQAFFRALGAAEVHAVDHSDFEGADIIHDMNQPIGLSLEAIADLVLDGSTLDNVHDPATALMNYNRMLRPGGRVFSINAAKPDILGAYTGMSPGWFLDYYALNGYTDCRVYVQLNFSSGPQALMATDYRWAIERGHAPPLDHDGWAFAIVIAEKGPTSSWDKLPTRAHLRTPAEQAQWVASIERFSASKRPSFRGDYAFRDCPPLPGYLSTPERAIGPDKRSESRGGQITPVMERSI